MPDQKITQYKLKKGRYRSARGGNSHFLDLYCSECNQHLVLYQKDGVGRLLRLYLDRIFEPQNLSILQSKIKSKAEMPNLECPKCETCIGIPMLYKPENRLAFRLVFGSFVKKKSKGFYPLSNQV